MTTAVEWRCGPPTGEYTMIWSSCVYRQICMALLSVACVGFPLCSRDWFQNSSSKTLRPFIVFFGSEMENLMEMFYFALWVQIKFYSLALYCLSLCLLLISLWKQMIYVQSSHLSLCVIPIRLVVLCACLCSLWGFIETTDCRTAYWRIQTIFRGNAKSH